MFGNQPKKERRMQDWRAFLPGLACTLYLLPVFSLAAPVDQEIEQLRVQVSEHSARVFALEQELLHPADTRLAVFLTLGSQDALDLDSLELFVDGQPVASHLYSERERGSLEAGGIQQLFIGNLPNGEHELKAVVTARSAKDHFVRREAIHRFEKRPGTLRLEMSLEARAPTYDPQVSFVEWK